MSESWDSEDVEPRNKVEEEECERDDLYYFETVVFKVENTLFRVPKSGLNVDGTVFETMFTLPAPQDGGCTEGSNDQHPITLKGISKAHFRGFLRSIYRFTATPLTYEEMAGALQLATMWDFRELRERLVSESYPQVKEKPVHEIISLARACKVKQWLIDAYTSLILAKSHADLFKLCKEGTDATTIANLFFIREEVGVRTGHNQPQVSSGSYCSRCGTYNCCARYNNNLVNHQEVPNKINEVFASEFAEMEVSTQ